MGLVYKAEATKLECLVAITFFLCYSATNSGERQRFKVEAKTAAALNHPNIASIHNIEEVDDEIFIVMEHIDGNELKDRINVDPLSIDATLDIATQITEGLPTAHEKVMFTTTSNPEPLCSSER